MWAMCSVNLSNARFRRDVVDKGATLVFVYIGINDVWHSNSGKGTPIAEYESGEVKGSFLYGVTQGHKHLPEIKLHGGLSTVPVFVPSVGQYAQGMALVLHMPDLGEAGMKAADEALRAYYEGERFVAVVDPSVHEPRVWPERLNGTNRLELSVHGNSRTGAATLVAVLDNLGKGASGAAVQNLNILLGVDEGTGL